MSAELSLKAQHERKTKSSAGIPLKVPELTHILRVERLRGLVESNDQRRVNGTLYKRFWTLHWDRFKNDYDWTLSRYPGYLFDHEEVLAFAEVGVRGR